MRGDNPNYSIVEIGKNTEKSPGDLRRLAVNVKNSQGVNNNNINNNNNDNNNNRSLESFAVLADGKSKKVKR